MSDATVYGLVLAGGQSRRMGRDKALLKNGRQTQLAYAVSQLESVCAKVFVSVRSDQEDDPDRALVDKIVDRYDDMGPVAGILSALQQHPQVDWLVLACDLPNVTAGTLNYLLENAGDDDPLVAYRSSYDGLPEPLCALYRAGSRQLLRQNVEDGIHCPRKILIRCNAMLIDQQDARSLDNVNTPEDLVESRLEAEA